MLTAHRPRIPEGPRREDAAARRVFQLRALAQSHDAQGARAALERYFQGGTITMTPEPHATYARPSQCGDFMPLALLADKAETSSDRHREGVVHE